MTAVSREIRALIQAAGLGDLPRLTALLETYASTSPDLPRDPRLLLEAATGGHAPVVEFLLSRGADPNSSFARSRPLHTAIQPRPQNPSAAPPPGQLDVVHLLLSRGADLSSRAGFPPTTPLLLAALTGNLPIVETLLARGAPVDFFAACALARDSEVTAALTADPALASATDANSLTGLHYASASRLWSVGARFSGPLVEIARHLLDAGADPNRKARLDTQLLPPLYWAASARHIALVQLLLDRGANPTEGFSAATWNGTQEISELLLDRGARIDDVSENGVPLLYDLVHWGQLEKAEWLLSKGANPNLREPNGQTPLHAAAIRGSAPMVQALLHQGADVNAIDAKGHTPLRLAHEHKKPIIADLLSHYSAHE